MAWIRSTRASLLLLSLACMLPAGANCAADEKSAAAKDSWDSVKLIVARHHVASDDREFFRSLHWWADEREGREGPGSTERLARDEVSEDLSAPEKAVVHIRGNLTAALRIKTLTEVVIGGNVTRSGRIDAEGIVAIHVQGDMDGVLASRGSARVWVGGNLRGEVLTGEPIMRLLSEPLSSMSMSVAAWTPASLPRSPATNTRSSTSPLPRATLARGYIGWGPAPSTLWRLRVSCPSSAIEVPRPASVAPNRRPGRTAPRAPRAPRPW